MKYLKIIVGLGFISLGVFAGSFIHIGNGSGEVIGFVIGFVLCCVLFVYGKHRSSASSLDDQYELHNNVDKQAIDTTNRSLQEAGQGQLTFGSYTILLKR